MNGTGESGSAMRVAEALFAASWTSTVAPEAKLVKAAWNSALVGCSGKKACPSVPGSAFCVIG